MKITRGNRVPRSEHLSEPVNLTRMAVLQGTRALGAALCAGFILFFFSETLFWGRPGRAPLAELGLTWLAYSVLAGATLWTLAHFRARGLPSLVLCGALYGWLAEGVLAGTLYQAFPMQVSWTGLAWHDLLSVCAGWYGLSTALRRGIWPTVLTTSGLGVFWGAWATTWWQPQEGGFVTPLPAFAAHAFIQGLLLAASFAVFPRLLGFVTFTSHTGSWLLALFLGAWFALVTAPQYHLALLILPPLLALTVVLLRRGRTGPDSWQTTSLRADTPQDSLMALLSRPPRWRRCAAVLLMPGWAVAVYVVLLTANVAAPINLLTYWVLTPLGFVAYGFSVWKVWHTPDRV